MSVTVDVSWYGDDEDHVKEDDDEVDNGGDHLKSSRLHDLLVKHISV